MGIGRNLLGAAFLVPLIVRIMLDWPYGWMTIEQTIDLCFLGMFIIGLCVLLWGRDKELTKSRQIELGELARK